MSVETKQEKSSIYHTFCQAFDYVIKHFNDNEYNSFITSNALSAALGLPIAQFMVDIYFQCVVKYNLTVNNFMTNSKFLSMLPHNSKPWQTTRRYLSRYLKYVYTPVHCNLTNDIQIDYKHNMAGILFYTSLVHENIYILNRACQIDVMFIPKFLDFITEKYFSTLGIKYEKLNHQQNMKQMLRHLNDRLDDNKFNRCVILIMENNDISTDTVYAFQPLKNNSLPPEIYNHTETPWIANTKSNILPDLASTDYDSLCLSFHRHSYHNNSVIERVYLSCGRYGSRVFKHNFTEILAPFCVSKDEHPMIDWDEEINDREFEDYEYNFFLNTFFADFQLVKPNVCSYLNDCKHMDNAWIKFLAKCVTKDKELSLECMYVPSPIEYYEYIDAKMAEYYKSMNKLYNHQFITFIYGNELEDCGLLDNLGENVEINDCVLLDFDEFFPMSNDNNNLGRDEFLFNFLQNLFL